MRSINSVKRWLIQGLPALALFAALALQIASLPILETARDQVFDLYQRARPRPSADMEMPVRIVDLDDESLRRLGQWPWPRNQVARLIDALNEQGVRVIAMDIV